MKIVKESTSYRFADVKLGTVFAKRENIYMATRPFTVNKVGLELNAVNLKTGELVYFSDDDFVQIVHAELSVRTC